jgi:ribosome-binding factor A
MQATRRLRLQAVIQEELSHFVSRELKDPRVPPITVTSVELTEDASQATIFISILGGSKPLVPEGATPEAEKEAEKAGHQKMKDCLKGLSSASGFLRRHLGKVLQVRHIPSLIFKEDRGFENSIRVHELLKKISTTSS